MPCQMHVRDGSGSGGSGGIVSQMKASIESKSKAKAASGNPSSAVPNSTKQKINVSSPSRSTSAHTPFSAGLYTYSSFGLFGGSPCCFFFLKLRVQIISCCVTPPLLLVQVFEALTKRTRSDTVAPLLSHRFDGLAWKVGLMNSCLCQALTILTM